MKSLLAVLLALASLALHAADVPLVWNASPTTGITNYTIYASTNAITAATFKSSVVHVNVGPVLTVTLQDIAPGHWWFVGTAWKDGIESAPSNILPVEVAVPMGNLRTITLQYGPTITNMTDVGFFKVKIQ